MHGETWKETNGDDRAKGGNVFGEDFRGEPHERVGAALAAALERLEDLGGEEPQGIRRNVRAVDHVADRLGRGKVDGG